MIISNSRSSDSSFFLLGSTLSIGRRSGRVDENSDDRISLIEFKNAQEKIEVWVGAIDPEQEFKAIDKNGGGIILFSEFCDWAIKKSLDLEG